jgi:hypothetical protein
MISRLSTACYAVRSIFPVSNTDSLKSIYLAYFSSIKKYRISFGGYLFYSKMVFTAQNITVRIVSGVEPRNSCTSLLMRLEILSLQCESIVSLMNFVVNNQEHFHTNSTI